MLKGADGNKCVLLEGFISRDKALLLMSVEIMQQILLACCRVHNGRNSDTSKYRHTYLAAPIVQTQTHPYEISFLSCRSEQQRKGQLVLIELCGIWVLEKSLSFIAVSALEADKSLFGCCRWVTTLPHPSVNGFQRPEVAAVHVTFRTPQG